MRGYSRRTPCLLRLKSILRYALGATAAMPYRQPALVVAPAILRSGSSNDFSGVLLVISSNVETDILRRPAEVGLYRLIAITPPQTDSIRLAVGRQGHDRLFARPASGPR